MRPEEKEAATAARELLKADVLRGRRGTASQSRKPAAAAVATAQKRKAAAAGAATATEQMRCTRAGQIPEQNSGGTPPAMPFNDGSCFLNGANSFFGAPSHFGPFKPPQSMSDSAQEDQMSSPPASVESNQYVTIDSPDELPRTEKRILWTQEEDVKMMSSWLHNSTDPTIGADRKNEQYWNDVVGTYNETTPSIRRRNVKQIKDRFHKVLVIWALATMEMEAIWALVTREMIWALATMVN
nr:unnamed protein product [Digitaria exilis]